MRLDHLLSKESAANEEFAGVPKVRRVKKGITLFNLEGTRGKMERNGPIAQLARAHD